jgi:hypothetical protein
MKNWAKTKKRRNAPLAASGILLAALGLVGLLHPRFLMPGDKNEVEVGSQKVIMETRQVFVIPVWLAGAFFLIGATAIYLGTQRR